MKLSVLSSRPDLYSTRRLVEEAVDAGFVVDVVDYRQCSLGIGQTARVLFHGSELHPQVLIPRIGHRSSRFGAAVIRQFHAMGVPSTLNAVGLTRARDKFATLQALSVASIPVPVTSAARMPSGLPDVLELVNGTPVVVKLLEGSQGSGVVLAETRKAAESLLAAFHQLNADMCVQEFIKESRGQDLRVLVVDGVAIAAMERTSGPGEFRANLHQGGTARAVDLADDERAIAIAAARCVGVDVAGVDLLRTENGPVVIEVNASPGLQGIESVSGVNVAAEIVSYARRLAS